ncbi:MAG: hypothetical protein J7L89_10360 [Bacteroidales bacterium]|nr:hypothetical protein [Bacteroidales bacterium]
MKKPFELIIILVIPWTIILFLVATVNSDRDTEYFNYNNISLESKVPVVDHSQFTVLNKQFNNPSEVTAACLSCHNGRGEEIMMTEHWRYLKSDSITGRGTYDLGKKKYHK